MKTIFLETTSLILFFVSISIFEQAGAAVAAHVEVLGVESGFVNYVDESKIQILDYVHDKPPRLSIVAENGAAISNCRLNGIDCKGSTSIPLEFRNEADGTFSAHLEFEEAGSSAVSRKIRIVIGAPEFKVRFTGKSKLDENILLTPRGLLVMLSPMGDLLFYRQDLRPAHDFKSHRIADRTYYSYMRIDSVNLGLNQEGQRVLLDDKFRISREFPWNADGHEFLMLGKNRFVHSEYRIRDVNSPALNKKNCYVDQQLIETNGASEKVRFSTFDLFNSGFRPQMFVLTEIRGRRCFNFLHLNYAQVVRPNQWLIGLGSQVILFDIKSKRVLWALGGLHDDFDVNSVPAVSGALTYMHAPVLDEKRGILTLFANLSDRENSRVHEFTLDFEKHKVTENRTYSVGKFSADHSGGIVVKNGIVSIAFGHSKIAPADFVEISRDAEKPNMTIDFLEVPRPYIYRVDRQPVLNP